MATHWVIYADVNNPDQDATGTLVATAVAVGRARNFDWWLAKAGILTAAPRPTTGQLWPR